MTAGVPSHTVLEDFLSERLGGRVQIEGERSTGGSALHQSRLVEVKHAEGSATYFVKSGVAAAPDQFETEAFALQALGRCGVLPVPQVIGVSREPSTFLVLEAITPGERRSDFSATFGRALAALHQAPVPFHGPEGESFGFPQDNYLGRTPQPNGWCSDWVDFFREHRLGHMLRLVERANLGSPVLLQLGDRLLHRLDAELADPAEPAALLHGDLWGGNYMVGADGGAVLVDPAAYQGRREADLAMTQLFGGFSPSFYDAYQDVWPLAPGAPRRLEIYKLYHLLNHLVLFGTAYHDRCLASLRHLV